LRLLIINGPNLNLTGIREPEIYGNQSFEDYFRLLKDKYAVLALDYFQSNHEGALIDQIHTSKNAYDGIIINAGAYTHTSIAIADALKAVNIPAVEVHISNIFGREEFRKNSYISPIAIGVISGLGLDGYNLAVQYFINKK
jgi:3-dehydroquinate dehydratase-2